MRRSDAQKLRVCMYIRGVARLDPRVTRAASALLTAGFTVYVLDIENENTRPQIENIDGMCVKHMHKPDWLIPQPFPVRLLRSIEKFLYSIFYLWSIPADIYHAHNDNALLSCFIVALLHRKPLIFEAHEMPLYALEHVNRWLRQGITTVFKAIIPRCAGVIVVSPPIVQAVQRDYHVSNIALVRNIPSYKVVLKGNRLREYLELSPTTRIVLYQGNLQPDRCLDTLARTTQFLRQDVVVVLMGKDVGSTASMLERIAEQEGRRSQLKIVPPVPQNELLEWTASADVGIIISSPDYSMNTRVFLPNKLFEYMMAGLPILTSPLMAVKEILLTYNVGCVLSSLQPKDIALEIHAMLDNDERLDRMSRNARLASQQVLCWEKEKRALLHLYYQILSRQPTNQKSSETLQILEAELSLSEGAQNAYSLHL